MKKKHHHEEDVKVVVQRNALGTATYTLFENGKLIQELAGGWDDTTPWQNGTYVVPPKKGGYLGAPAFTFAGQVPGRTGILLHQDFNHADSTTSVGCLVAPPAFLEEVKAALGHKPGSRLEVDVEGEDEASQITLTAKDPSYSSNDFVKLTLGLSAQVSKDIWVFVTVNNPDDPGGNQFDSADIQKQVLVLDDEGNPIELPDNGVQLSAGMQAMYNVAGDATITDGKGEGDNNPQDHNQNGFWVRIPAKTTSEEIDIKPVYKPLLYDPVTGDLIPGPDRNETFTVSDYGIVYSGSRSSGAHLYKDGANMGPSATNLLTNGSLTEAPVSVTIYDQSHSISGNGTAFLIKDLTTSGPYGGIPSKHWTIGLDPDKSHQIKILQFFDAEVTLTATVLDEHGVTQNVNLKKTGDSLTDAGRLETYTIDDMSLDQTEGVVTFEASCEDPHGFTVNVDGAGNINSQLLHQSSPEDLVQRNPVAAPNLAAQFTPPGTGVPNTFTSDDNVTTETDASGNVIFRQTVNDDGSRDVMTYRVADQPFTSTDRIYDASGNVVSATLYKDDGSVFLSGTGTLNYNGTTTVSFTDQSGAIAGQEIDDPYYIYRPGSTDLTIDVSSTQAIPSTESVYGPYGDLVSRTFYDQDGAVTKTESVSFSYYTGLTTATFDDANGTLIEADVSGIQNQPYAGTETFYDTSGDATTIVRTEADGSPYETGTSTQEDDGSVLTTFVTTSGVLAEKDLQNTDGTSEVSVYGITGQPYTTSQSTFGAFGNLVSQTLIYADGSVYQTTQNSGYGTTILTYAEDGSLASKEIDEGTRDITTYGIQGQPYDAIEVLYGYDGSTLSKTLFNNDGTQEVITYPSPYGYSTTTTDAIYDAAGDLSSETVYNADGSIAQTETVDVNADGSKSIRLMDGSGSPISTETDGVDGSRDITVYGIAGQAVASDEKTYDPDGTLTAHIVVNADGSREVTAYGVADQPSTTSDTLFDANGNAVARKFYDLDGTLVQSDIIATGADGTTTIQAFDALGYRVSVESDRADGTKSVINYGEGAADAVSSTALYDAGGRLTSETFFDSNGGVSSTIDTAVDSQGTVTTDKSDGSGRLTSRQVTAADGTSEVLTYAATGQLESEAFLDAGGNLTSETFLTPAGSISESETVVENADGSTTTSLSNGSGVLLSRETDNADGSGTVTTFGIVKKPYSSSQNVLGSGGTLIEQDFFDLDGTKETLAFNGDGTTFTTTDSIYGANGSLLSGTSWTMPARSCSPGPRRRTKTGQRASATPTRAGRPCASKSLIPTVRVRSRITASPAKPTRPHRGPSLLPVPSLENSSLTRPAPSNSGKS